MHLFKKKRSRGNRLFMSLAILWDLAWRVAAVRVAFKRHQIKWAISLATVSSMGALPMFYLWRQRGLRRGQAHGAAIGSELEGWGPA